MGIRERNKLQITGSTEDSNPIEHLSEKCESFGFNVQEAEGNRIESMGKRGQKIPFQEGMPNMIIANTIKGAGISFIENQVSWHDKVPTQEEFNVAIQELEENFKTA